MADRITDVWFRSALSLSAIARSLELTDMTEDAENQWAWIIGNLMGARLDITRLHTRSAEETYTRVFLLDGESFPDNMLAEIVTRLRAFVPGSILCGRWEHRSGDDFNLVAVRQR